MGGGAQEGREGGWGRGGIRGAAVVGNSNQGIQCTCSVQDVGRSCKITLNSQFPFSTISHYLPGSVVGKLLLPVMII